MSVDKYNLMAIKTCESIGIEFPSQAQIDVIERLIKVYAQKDEQILSLWCQPLSEFCYQNS